MEKSVHTVRNGDSSLIWEQKAHPQKIKLSFRISTQFWRRVQLQLRVRVGLRYVVMVKVRVPRE